MISLAVLGGELAVPCTRNPLMRGRMPYEVCRRRFLSVSGDGSSPMRQASYEPRQARKGAAVSKQVCAMEGATIYPETGEAFCEADRVGMHGQS